MDLFGSIIWKCVGPIITGGVTIPPVDNLYMIVLKASEKEYNKN